MTEPDLFKVWHDGFFLLFHLRKSLGYIVIGGQVVTPLLTLVSCYPPGVLPLSSVGRFKCVINRRGKKQITSGPQEAFHEVPL